MEDLLDGTNGQALRDDLFLIPHDGQYIIYRPGVQMCALVNAAASQEVASYLKSDGQIVGSSSLDELAESGFFQVPNRPSFEGEETSMRDTERSFRPHEVTLDITWRCNLRCIYCYGRGGEIAMDMNPDCARAAVDLCLKHCREEGREFTLNFHGSGEPVQNMKLLAELVEYSRNATSAAGLPFRTSIATNVMNHSAAEWIASNIDRISLSFDGDADSQNLQRPLASGGPSADLVLRTADLWKSLNKRFNLRLTITSQNVSRMTDICLGLGSRYPGSQINIEPMTLCGRAHDVPGLTPEAELFAEHLVATYKATKSTGTVVYYSGMRGFSRSHAFCSASTPGFSVMADGSVTACFSYSSHEPVRNKFVYGAWDTERRSFDFSPAVIADLRKLTMDNDPYCRDCYAKFHCIGDCPSIREYKLLEDQSFAEEFDVDFTQNRRCKINRMVLKLLLVELLKHQTTEE
jgi:uncharacterized protein